MPPMINRMLMMFTAAVLTANPFINIHHAQADTTSANASLQTRAAAADIDNTDNAAGVWQKKKGRPLIIAHRGGAGIFPENTIAAMRGSALLGVDVLDMDARLSKDGILVAFHDKTLQRTTNGNGEIGDFRYDELKTLNAAARFLSADGDKHPPQSIPRIEDILREFADTGLLFVIEIKNQGDDGKLAAQKLAAIVKEQNLQERVIVGSFGGAPLEEYRKQLPAAATSASQGEAAGVILLGGFYSPPLVALQLPPAFAGINLAAAARMDEWQKRGYAVHYWTINDAPTMMRLVNDGADGIFSDYPDRLREVLTDKGYPLPKPVITAPPAK